MLACGSVIRYCYVSSGLVSLVLAECTLKSEESERTLFNRLVCKGIFTFSLESCVTYIIQHSRTDTCSMSIYSETVAFGVLSQPSNSVLLIPLILMT